MSKKKASFSRMLKDNEKKVVVKINGEEKKLKEMIEDSASNVVCTSLDSVVPVSVNEAVENAVAGKSNTSVDVSYAQTAWSLYENALKFSDTKQTMLILATASDIEYILDGQYDELEPLYGRTNLQLVMDAIPEKNWTRLKRWANEPSKYPDMFVLRIPNLVLFTNSIQKNVATVVRTFDLVVCFVATEKKLYKTLKKHPDTFKEISKFSVEKAISVLKDFGSSCVHITIDSKFAASSYSYAETWLKAICQQVSKRDILTRFVFCTTDADSLVEFSAKITSAMLDTVLFGGSATPIVPNIKKED